MATITLYRPVNKYELELIKLSDWKKFPSRLAQQPIFYPVLNRDYALEISAWNKIAYGEGYITKFEILKEYIDNFEIHNVGAKHHNEYWIPAEELEEFNNNIVGKIKLI